LQTTQITEHASWLSSISSLCDISDEIQDNFVARQQVCSTVPSAGVLDSQLKTPALDSEATSASPACQSTMVESQRLKITTGGLAHLCMPWSSPLAQLDGSATVHSQAPASGELIRQGVINE
jgi:hypothetical protein